MCMACQQGNQRLKRTGLCIPDCLITHHCNLWFAVTEAGSQEAYDEAITVLQKEAPTKFVSYLEETWIPYASKFVAFHTNQHFHLGQRTSSRVGGAHAKIKRQLQTSRCDVNRLVETCLSIVDSYLQQWRQGEAVDEISISMQWLEEPFLVDIVRKVSAKALDEVSEGEQSRVGSEVDKILVRGWWRAVWCCSCFTPFYL